MSQATRRGRALGIGGVFFKAGDTGAIGDWYRDALGFDIAEWGGALFPWQREDGKPGWTVWSPFASDTTYFDPGDKPYMINLLVDDLDSLLAHLRERGDRVLDRAEQTEQGRFAYVLDPEGTLLELWEPCDEPALG
ncbi:MAG: VOC family protein [Xanthomonadales bacterium]|nr:VOC family protein [Xanthomonadales bacterium]